MPVTQYNCIACGNALETPILSNAGQLCRACSGQGTFRKNIIITGITRMNNGHICVSGIDPLTMRFVRPIFRTGIERDFVMDGSTQVIQHFNVVEIEFKNYRPCEDFHTEDWIINENFAPKFVRHLTDIEIVSILNNLSINNLSAAMATHDKSLFIVRGNIQRIWHEFSFGKFKVRMNFRDQSGNIFNKIPVTDLLTLAFVRYQLNKNMNYSAQLIRLFNNNPYRYIRIGLTRLFHGQHWKQVTALITIPDLFNGNSFSYYEKKVGEMV